MIHVILHRPVLELAANQALCVKNSVGGVPCCLALGCITNEPLCVSESHERRGRALALGVLDDVDAIMLPDANTREGRAKIDADRWGLLLLRLLAIRQPNSAERPPSGQAPASGPACRGPNGCCSNAALSLVAPEQAASRQV
mmetsp:Transcript_60658/g.141317  ORF Transcript_60658/g.141317 Transcript_60658/m.141317 type:complete len:142 (-) Transcript_60658:152-577(-)